MRDHNPENERIKRQYFRYLRESKRRYSDASIDKVAAAIARFEAFGKYRSFKLFHLQQAIAFKRHLESETTSRSGQPLSPSTVYSILRSLRDFFDWLADQRGYKSRFNHTDADYFTPSGRDTMIARTTSPRPFPSVTQLVFAVRQMPVQTDIQKRDRAILAFAALTGMRDMAIASVKLKHVDLARRCVQQDAHEVRTKFSKTQSTAFYPLPAELRLIVEDWVQHLNTVLLWGPDDPLFPRTQMRQDAERRFAPVGVAREHWTSADAIRRIFRVVFTAAGFEPFNPHSVRHMLVAEGYRRCNGRPGAFKAWSQNLGHERMMTTLTSYGRLPFEEQSNILWAMADADEVGDPADDPEVQELMRQLQARIAGRRS